MFRTQITIAIACASLICASTTGSTINPSKQSATARQLVLVARGSQPAGGTTTRGGGKSGKPHHDDKPVVKA
jgi:hypothetical protein